MAYCNEKTVEGSFAEIKEAVIAALKAEGMGVISEINMKAALKEKINADIPEYQILGACHPPSAFKAVSKEKNIGVLLPCNFIIRQEGENSIVIAAVNPMQTMQSVLNPELNDIAEEISAKINRVLESI